MCCGVEKLEQGEALSVVVSQDHIHFFRRTQVPGWGYSHILPIRVCAAQRGCDFEAPDLERGIHFRGVF